MTITLIPGVAFEHVAADGEFQRSLHHGRAAGDELLASNFYRASGLRRLRNW